MSPPSPPGRGAGGEASKRRTYQRARRNGGEFSHYAHLKQGSVRVKVGDAIARGQVLAQLGQTGNSTEPHLHFQLTDGQDPMISRGIPIVFKNTSVEGLGFEGRPLQEGMGIPLSANAYGDEAGPFETRIVDLRRSRTDDVPVFDFGFVFVTRQHQGTALDRPNLVRTDELGTAHSYPCCERKVSVSSRPIEILASDVFPDLERGTANPIDIPMEDLPLKQEPCDAVGKDG